MNTNRALMGTVLALSVSLWMSAPAFSNDDYGLPTAEPESLGMSTEKLGAIKANLQPLIDEHKVPGFVTVVARKGKIVHSEAFGSMDVERKKAMRPDTIFRMASMTKPITGAAVMILVQEGKIAVSDPLSKYIPEFAEMKVLVQNEGRASSTVPADKPITIEHLLTHTSGLTESFFPNAVAKLYAATGLGLSFEQIAALRGSGVIEDAVDSDGLTLEEFVKKAAEQPLLVQPGTQWNYSIAMDVLGRVVEVVSGQRYGDFLQERIFAPLGMKDAGFHVPKEKVARFAANYAPQAAGMVLTDDPAQSSFLKVPSRDSGSGGMVGTATDYLRFAQMLLNGGELDGVRILSEESVQEMTSDHLGPEFGDAPLSTIAQAFGADLPPEVIQAFKGIGFGYCGSVVRDGAGNTLFGTPGQYSWGGAWSTDFWIDRPQKLVGLVLTQITVGTYPIRMILNDATYEALVERYE